MAQTERSTLMNDAAQNNGQPAWAVSPWNRAGIEAAPIFSVPPRVSDCTLRDGEQMAGVVFTRQDKVEIARQLDALGIDDLEVGTPAVSDEDRLAAEDIAGLGLRATITALARAIPADVDLLVQCGVAGARISQPISARQRDAKTHWDDEAYLKLALEITSYAKQRGLQVIFSAYDTTRADLGLLERLLRMFEREGCVDRIRLVDTAGAASPEAITFLVHFMIDASGGIPIEVHCHNDFGLGTANTLAGALAGASYLSTTINGLGERAGNTALEEVVMALKVLYGVDLGVNTTLLRAISEEVERRSGVPLQAHKAIVGKGAFVHETGMVVAGVLNDPFTAEAYAPELVGQVRSIVVGKKSGKASIQFKLEQFGLSADEQSHAAILADVKARSIELKRALSDDEFRHIADQRGVSPG
jgi:isopropylmalate/homocitrate/citramalate synthase